MRAIVETLGEVEGREIAVLRVYRGDEDQGLGPMIAELVVEVDAGLEPSLYEAATFRVIASLGTVPGVPIFDNVVAFADSLHV